MHTLDASALLNFIFVSSTRATAPSLPSSENCLSAGKLIQNFAVQTRPYA